MKKLPLHKIERITNRENDSFKKYLLEINSIEVLDADQEYEISVLAKTGDKEALRLLVHHNLRFVVSVAKQYVTNTLKLEDLVNEGNLGLVLAAKRFDPSRGFKFISYGVWWVRRSILAYISEYSRTIRIPNNKNNIIHKLKVKCESLEQKLEHTPTLTEMIIELGNEFSVDELTFYFNNEHTKLISLDAPILNVDGNEFHNELFSNSSNSGIISMDEIINNEDAKYKVNKLLAVLPKEKSRDVLTLIYGLNGNDPLTLKSVGLKLGLTSERVRQIRDSALIKLKEAIDNK